MFAECQRAMKLKPNLLVKDMKVRWNTTYDMISCLIHNEEAIALLPGMYRTVEWPLLTDEDWMHLKELSPFLSLFKVLTLYFSSTTECRMSDICMDFEDLLVDIKLKYLDKKDDVSDRLWYAANAAYTKLTKYYVKISSENYAIATVLDPRYKLDAFDHTQDPEHLKESAKAAVEIAFGDYSFKYSSPVSADLETQNSQPSRDKNGLILTFRKMN
jgi:hypothetical protein